MKEKDIIFIKLEIIEWKKVNKTMKQSEKVAYWIEIAEYDLETAKAMLDTKRYLYVGFMCHQAIEKILKAVYVAKFPSETPPYTHNLIKLARLSGIFDLLVPEQIFFVNKLEPLNIESHYPKTKKVIASALTKERCEAIINQTNELYQWIKNQL